jgi:flagellar biogenesis protein FliO
VGLMVFQETTMGNGTPQQPDGGGLATFATIVFMGLIILLVAVVCYRILTRLASQREAARGWNTGTFLSWP